MRTLALTLALGLFAVSTTAVAACNDMQTAQKDQVIASSSNAKTQSTPIPPRQDGDS